MKNIFLSGGHGCIGRNIVENNSSYIIDAPARSALELTDCQAVDAYFAKKHYSAVINAASIAVSRKSTLDPKQGFYSNLRAFAALFKQRAAYDRFIQLGSGAEYGRPLTRRQITEEEFEQSMPADEYGLAKFYCTQSIMSQPPAKAVSLHLFGVFGPYEDYQVRFISNAIVRAMHDLPITMHQDVEFDYVYVKDLVKILNLFIEKTPNHPHYNITTGEPITLLALAEIVREVIGNNVDIIVKNPGLAPAYTGCNQRLKTFLPEFQFTPIKDAIKELATWYEQHSSLLNKEWILNPI